MGMTRREILGRGGLLAAFAAMPEVALGASGAQPEAAGNSVKLSRTLFESAAGSSFEVQSGTTKQYLTLLKVEDLQAAPVVGAGAFAKNPSANASMTQTSGYFLVFTGGSKPLAQGTYTFKSASLGSMQIFIVPTGNRQMQYVATFATR
ncbi:hypothetical protein Acid345_2456 [Candidatus Koribacter versatilis Ellin345]|uniref:DUF6916 domain-containing protein n=1 Tax=Koribacter versatilis (strain Ellin345) TaxID=204669 RepID=Q1INU3_KORVE|nr:hypothetical protein [Candidatus Koribacter versatilis]ABF41457.1 hypothetical protein Acid345_2456 [Candidatus Koribacter versatilis Ellin345]